MRVTNGTLVSHSLNNLKHTLERLDRINKRISTGKRISLPSDDPAGVVASLRLRSSLAEVEQYKKNVESGISWLNATDSALAEVTAVIKRAHELAIKGASDAVPQDARDSIALEVDELIDHLIQVGNTVHDGRYLFGGQDVLTKPFEPTGTPDVTGVSYLGGTDPLVTEIASGIRMELNFSGDEIFWNPMAAMIKLRDDLRSGDMGALSGADIDAMDAALNTVLYYRAEAGAKVNRLERTATRYEDLEINVTALMSENEDADIAETIMELKMEENVYQAALSSGARIIQPSLLDFLK